jgi:hypothetical protein
LLQGLKSIDLGFGCIRIERQILYEPVKVRLLQKEQALSQRCTRVPEEFNLIVHQAPDAYVDLLMTVFCGWRCYGGVGRGRLSDHTSDTATNTSEMPVFNDF